MSRFWVDRRAVTTDTRNLAGWFQSVEVEDGQSRRNIRCRWRPSTRDVQTPSSGVGIDIIPAALSADLGSLNYLIGAPDFSCPRPSKAHDYRCGQKLSHANPPDV